MPMPDVFAWSVAQACLAKSQVPQLPAEQKAEALRQLAAQNSGHVWRQNAREMRDDAPFFVHVGNVLRPRRSASAGGQVRSEQFPAYSHPFLPLFGHRYTDMKRGLISGHDSMVAIVVEGMFAERSATHSVLVKMVADSRTSVILCQA